MPNFAPSTGPVEPKLTTSAGPVDAPKLNRSAKEKDEEKKHFMSSVGNTSNSSNSSGNKLASVSTTATMQQKESLLINTNRKLSNDLEQINEEVHVEDACEDELNDGCNSIKRQRLQNYDKPLTKSDLSNLHSEPTSPLEFINSAQGSEEENKIPSFGSYEEPNKSAEEQLSDNRPSDEEFVLTATVAEDISPP